MKNISLFLLAVLSLALIGCGQNATVGAAPPDVSPTGAPLTVEQYSAKLTELGADSQKLLAPDMKTIQDAKTETDQGNQQQMILGAFQHLATIQDSEVGKYEAVNPPAELAKAHAIIVQANKDISQNFREGAAAMQNKEFDKLDALMTKLQKIAQDLIKNLTAALDAAGYKLDDAGNIVKK